MAGVIDTNVLLFAANRSAPEHAAAAGFLESAASEAGPWYLTEGIAYEFLRVATHPRVFERPLEARDALRFLVTLLDHPGFLLLRAGERHWTVVGQILREQRQPSGNLFFDIRTVALMREHGVKRIFTADADFLRFRGIDVTNPVAPES